MAKYKLWDKNSDIFTIGKDAETGKMRWTAKEYIERNAEWAASPAAKVIVGGGFINGTMFLEFYSMVDFYVQQGMQIPTGTSDEDILMLMEAWDNKPIEQPVTAQERIAAALEFQNLMSL